MIDTQTATRHRDLRLRALTGVVLLGLATAALLAGGWPFWLLAAASALLMVAEWCGLTRSRRRRITFALTLAALPLLLASPAALGPTRDAVALAAVAALVMALGAHGLRPAAGLLYALLPTIGLLFLRDRPDGLALTLWTLAIVWATDIGAFFAGRTIGGPRLAPAISPSKTWAGLCGGMIAAGLVGASVAGSTGLPTNLLWLGPPLAILAQAGDLFESWLKRRAGVKDSGRLLPGHGGALDRLDGVVPVATLIALLAAADLL